MSKPLTVINFFKLNDIADGTMIEDFLSDNEAFSKYAEVSIPKVAEVGGKFLLRGIVEGNFIGENLENWDLIAMGHYPKKERTF